MDRLIIIFYDTHSCVFKLKRSQQRQFILNRIYIKLYNDD